MNFSIPVDSGVEVVLNETGYMNEVDKNQFMIWFEKRVRAILPHHLANETIYLFCDNHDSNTNTTVRETCLKMLWRCTLSPHIPPISCKHVHRELKNQLKKTISKYKRHNHTVPQLHQFPELIYSAWFASFTPDNIKLGWQNTGFLPHLVYTNPPKPPVEGPNQPTNLPTTQSRSLVSTEPTNTVMIPQNDSSHLETLHKPLHTGKQPGKRASLKNGGEITGIEIG